MASHELSVLPVYRLDDATHSAGPVGSGASSSSKEKHYIGWVDTSESSHYHCHNPCRYSFLVVSTGDIAMYLLSKLGSDSSESGPSDTVRHLFTSKAGFTAGDATNASSVNPFWGIPLQRTMDQVQFTLPCMCENASVTLVVPVMQVVRVLSNHVHRVAVVDTDDANRVNGVITQSSVLWMHHYWDELLADVSSYAIVC